MKFDIGRSKNVSCPFDQKGISFSKTLSAPPIVRIFPFSFKIWITTIQNFQMTYITFLYLNGVKRYQLSKSEGIKISLFYIVNMRVFELFELWWLVSFDPLEVKKCYIPHLKGLNSGYWNLDWKLEYLCFDKRQINFSEKGMMFSLRGVAAF